MRSTFALLLLIALRVDAQAPTVFVHGLASRGSTWDHAMASLSADGTVIPFAPNLSWFRFYESQSQELAEQIQHRGWGHYPSNLFAIGHSNGGQIIRASMRMAGARYPGGAVTVTSPTRGAALAQNAASGLVTAYLWRWYWVWKQPFEYFPLYDDFFWIGAWSAAALLETVVMNSQALLGATIGTALDFNALNNSVLRDMAPGSAFLASINSPDNLAAEAVLAPRRLAISSRVDPWITSMYAGLAANDMYALTQAEDWLIASSLAAFVYYQFSDRDVNGNYYWDARTLSWMWLITAGELSLTDYVWCSFLDGWKDGECRSDGIVSFASQQWPGAQQVELFVGAPAHTQATSSASVISASRAFIRGGT